MFGKVLSSARRFGRNGSVIGHPSTRSEAATRTRLGNFGASVAVVSLLGGLLVTSVGSGVQAAPVGMGFTITPADLSFILEQIKIAEAHVVNTNSTTGPCGALVGTGPNQIARPELPFGLRTVDGTCNNLQPGQQNFGAADQPFPRMTTPVFRNAEGLPFDPDGVDGPAHAGDPTSYAQEDGIVADSEPRTISNLIVDQTASNPAAIAAAGFPVRTQGNPGVFPCGYFPDDPLTPENESFPPGCIPQHETLFIPNVTTDIGLSPPYNSLFTIFGQFFDHGLDKITNGGNGVVFVPLKDDDPLVLAGPDGIPGNGDEVPAGRRFMTLTRGKIVMGADGHRSALNTDSPFVDQSQTYTSHSSHQFFLREYRAGTAGEPVSTGMFLSSADGGLATWAMIKDQARTLLGMELVDSDVGNIPMISADPYGNYLPGPNGLPQYVTASGLVEGNLTTPVPAPTDVLRIETAFLNDIAHSAAPTAGGPDFVPAVPEGPGPDGILLDDPLTFPGGNEAADNTPAVAADPGPDGIFGTACGTIDATQECLDDTPAIPEGPGPDGILLDDPLTSPGGDESADNTPAIPAHDDLVAGASLDTPVPAGTYDDELLDLHFICGDGRCNENIALSAIHQVFHTEHDRLVAEFRDTIAANPALSAAYHATSASTFDFGERVFQAARFVTEMEYQHLVFEEFARKIQPAINPFEPFALNQTDINPAITAEYAHAVYRFGHSMLDEVIPRINEDGSENDIPLLTGFLNPGAYHDGGTAGSLTSKQAAGAIIMGLSDQVGNELDEFVANTLRNNLVGLPLDLPSINMTRARSEGIPSLNNVRKEIFAATNDGQLTPYANWIDFGQALKHPESLTNFVAAYGRHPSILAETTVVGKREAARLIVNPVLGDTTPLDALDFLGSTGDWANTGSVSNTGVDGIDLWVGGLAERTNPFGGLLGTTFNYVFETQLTNLQNGDRFYYLGRTPGMNLRAQLEGNSFAELVMRNTTAHTLKADSFATADCKFQMGNAPGIGSAPTGTSIPDDPKSECNENALLIRMPSGQVRYRMINNVDPPGINGQSVYNGTAGVDKIFGGNDNDTFLGNDGNDIIDGGSGDDVVLGGEGNDIITDLAGADVPKGGPGNDAIDGGIGDDIIQSGDGDDFTNGGGNLNVTFLGNGDDFAIAGLGLDAVLGGAGDDWEEGGDMPDLLIGDSSTFFFDDHDVPGNDVMIGQGGDDDGDGEGGDDIFVAGPGIEKNSGAAGFDWNIGLGDPQPQFQDLALKIIIEGGQPAIEARDKFNEVEALSGWNLNDILKGDSVAPFTVGGAGTGFIGCDALDQDGLDRIAGLDSLVPALATDSAPLTATTTTRYCNLVGNVWGDGNVILGGGGSDMIEGRGADDIIDGDKYMDLRISVRNGLNVEIGSTDLMEHVARSGTFGAGTAGMTLQQAVFAGLVDPGNLVIVREIVTPALPAPDCDALTPVNCDTAVFSGPIGNYTITTVDDVVGSITDPGGVLGYVRVVDNGAVDGTDIVRNVELLQFTDGVVNLVPAPVAEITAGSLAFGSQNNGTTSAARTITVTNSGNADLIVSTVTVTGANANQFAITNGCATVAAGFDCTVNVVFTPTSDGAKSATVTITHNAAGSPSTFLLSGTGVTPPPPAPVASVTAGSLAFGNQNTGSLSATRAITVTNTGNAPLTVSAVTLVGLNLNQFAIVSNTCTTVAPTASCIIDVSFSPTTSGAKTASVSIIHNAAGSPSILALTGTGVTPAVATATVADTAFGAIRRGVTKTRTAVVTNTGTANLVITAATTTAPFSVTLGTCNVAVAPGRTCKLNVSFSPTTATASTTPLTITSNATNSPSATLTGTGR